MDNLPGSNIIKYVDFDWVKFAKFVGVPGGYSDPISLTRKKYDCKTDNHCLKYDKLSYKEKVLKYKEIEDNPDLGMEEKVLEFHRLAYAEVYDLVGAWYELRFSDSLDFTIWSNNFEIVKKVIYTPTQQGLPTVIWARIHYYNYPYFSR